MGGGRITVDTDDLAMIKLARRRPYGSTRAEEQPGMIYDPDICIK